jgi:hypothetical protein
VIVEGTLLKKRPESFYKNIYHLICHFKDNLFYHKHSELNTSKVIVLQTKAAVE